MSKILIADRQTLIRKMLRTLLDADAGFDVVAEAADGGETIDMLQRFKADALILDMSMSGISGLDLISRAIATSPDLAILVLCKNSDTQFVTQAFKNGVRGYISTMHTPDEFLNALRKVLGGGRYVDAAFAESMLLDSISGEGGAGHTCLSERELEVFRLLVSGQGVNEIADQLIISNKTVSSHKKKLMEKMHFGGMADLMRYAVQRSLFDEHDTV
jgi:DNA-binding NarL/FixJ family response regulator